MGVGDTCYFCQIVHAFLWCVSALNNPYQINFGLSHWIRIMNKHSCSLAFISMTPSSMNSWRKIKVRSLKFYNEDLSLFPTFYWMLTAVFGDEISLVLIHGDWWNSSRPPYMCLNIDLLQIAVKLLCLSVMVCLVHILLILDKWMLTGSPTWATAMLNTRIIGTKVKGFCFRESWKVIRGVLRGLAGK